LLTAGERVTVSTRALSVVALIGVVAIAFYAFNSYLMLSNTRLQEQVSELNDAMREAKDRIAEMETILSALADKMNAMNQSLLDPSGVYKSVHKSVVLVRTPLGSGSGFLYDNANLILTNWHVVESSTDIEIEFYDGTRGKASVVGTDAYSDVAVLRVEASPTDAKPLQLSNSSKLYIGQQVVAIGNPLGLTGSLSAGYISQINKLIDIRPIIVPVLQLDVTIAPGSSGGPLLDLTGRVVGITNAGTGYGFNFAVPSNIVRRVASSLIEKGYYRHPFVGFSGVELSPETIKDLKITNLDPFQTGLLIWEVVSGTPAAEAGLRGVESQDSGGYIGRDIILAVDGHATRTFAEWTAYVEEYVSPGQTITLTLWRTPGDVVSINITTAYREPYQS